MQPRSFRAPKKTSLGVILSFSERIWEGLGFGSGHPVTSYPIPSHFFRIPCFHAPFISFHFIPPFHLMSTVMRMIMLLCMLMLTCFVFMFTFTCMLCSVIRCHIHFFHVCQHSLDLLVVHIYVIADSVFPYVLLLHICLFLDSTDCGFCVRCELDF